MKKIALVALAAPLFALAACGGKGDDKLGDQAKQAMDNKADAVDAMADNASGQTKEVLENKADAMRERGDQKEEAIDKSDVDATKLTNGQKSAIVNSN